MLVTDEALRPGQLWILEHPGGNEHRMADLHALRGLMKGSTRIARFDDHRRERQARHDSIALREVGRHELVAPREWLQQQVVTIDLALQLRMLGRVHLVERR